MKSLREYIAEAESAKRAIGHFNISSIDVFWAVIRGAQAASEEAGEQIPVIIGTSEGEREFFGIPEVVGLVHGFRERTGYPVFINADHTYSMEKAFIAIDAGYDMVIYDGNKVSHEENVENTKMVVVHKNSENPNCLIEAELGNIGAGSNLKDEIPEGVSPETMTDPSEALAFVQATGIDLLAPSVGNVHGMVKSGNPALNPERVARVREVGGVPLVLHGGSGSTDDDFRKVIAAGIGVVHISTEMRVAYHEALKMTLNETNQLSPYKYFKPAKEAVQQVVENRIKLFWGMA